MEKLIYGLMKTRTNCLTPENMFSLGHIYIHNLRANLTSLELNLVNLRFHLLQ